MIWFDPVYKKKEQGSHFFHSSQHLVSFILFYLFINNIHMELSSLARLVWIGLSTVLQYKQSSKIQNFIIFPHKTIFNTPYTSYPLPPPPSRIRKAAYASWLTIFRCNEMHIPPLFPTRLHMIMDSVWSNWNDNQKSRMWERKYEQTIYEEN